MKLGRLLLLILICSCSSPSKKSKADQRSLLVESKAQELSYQDWPILNAPEPKIENEQCHSTSWIVAEGLAKPLCTKITINRHLLSLLVPFFSPNRKIKP